MNPVLVIDSNYIAHRVFFKMGNLSYNEKMTGIIFGFLRSVLDLHERFKPSEIAFCWDSTKSYRKVLYPDYKGNRGSVDRTEEEIQDRNVAYYQFDELQEDILPRLGFVNIFSQNGIEADDLIAQIVIDHFVDKRHIIVSSDNDLFQLLDVADMFFVDKKALFTKADFENLWGISPADWLEVKAMAGDTSDNVPGLKGVGHKTAIKYLNGSQRSMKMVQLVEENTALIEMNRQLMRVPHPKTKPIIIRESIFNIVEFEKVCLENGLQFFLKKEQYAKWKGVLNVTDS